MLAACGQPERDELWRVYDAPGGDYRLRYLEPPWELVDSEVTRARFIVQNNASALGGRDSSLSAKYELTVDVEAGAPRARAMADERGASGRRETVVVGTRAVRTESGDEGFEVITRAETGELLYRRFIYLSHPRGVVRLLFEAVPNLDGPEVKAMVAAVDVLPGVP